MTGNDLRQLYGFRPAEKGSDPTAPAEWTAQHEVLRLPLGWEVGPDGSTGELVYAALGDPWAVPDAAASSNLGVYGFGDGRAGLVEQLTLRLASSYHGDAVEIVTIDFADHAGTFGSLSGIATNQFIPTADENSRHLMREWIGNQIIRRSAFLDWHGETTHREMIRRHGIASMPYLAVSVVGGTGENRCDLLELLNLMAVGRSLGVVTIVSVDPFTDRNGALGVYPTLREHLWSGVYLPADGGGEFAAPGLAWDDVPAQCNRTGLAVHTPPPLLVPVAVDTALLSYDELDAVSEAVRDHRVTGSRGAA